MTTASKDGLELIAVTINAGDDWNDHIAMYEHGFANYELVTIKATTIVQDIKDPFYGDHLFVARDFIYPVTKKEESLIRLERKLLRPQERWKETGVPSVVGRAELYIGNEKVDDTPIFYKQEKKKRSFFDWLLGVGRDG